MIPSCRPDFYCASHCIVMCSCNSIHLTQSIDSFTRVHGKPVFNVFRLMTLSSFQGHFLFQTILSPQILHVSFFHVFFIVWKLVRLSQFYIMEFSFVYGSWTLLSTSVTDGDDVNWLNTIFKGIRVSCDVSLMAEPFAVAEHQVIRSIWSG